MYKLLVLIPFLFFVGCASNEYIISVDKSLPFSESLAKAKQRVQESLKSDDKRPIVVEFEPGVYFLDKPMSFSAQDSGSKERPVSYIVNDPEKTLFSAGRKLPPFKLAENGLWTCKVPENWKFEQLFVNGKRVLRARTPNKGFIKISAIKETKADKKHIQTVNFPLGIFYSIPANSAGVQMVVLHKWDHTRRFIDSIDAKTGTLITSGKRMKPWNSWKKGTRVYFENFKEALDEAGEWYLDSKGSLFYKPMPGEDIEKTVAFAPVNEKYMILKGESGKPLKHISFSGFRFAYGAMRTPEGGFEPAQAAAPVEGAVMADFVENVNFDKLHLNHTGSYGVWFRKGCKNIRFENGRITDIGAGGIRIGEQRMRTKPEEQTSHITLYKNLIRDGGHIFPCAVGVWLGHASHNKIIHNDIGHLYYTAVSLGWTWGYKPTGTHNNIVKYNHLHNIGKGLLSDMGAVYTLGNSPGTVISHNVIHDVDSYSYGGWGLYTDEGSRDVVMENNLVYNTKSGGFHQHYGKDNIIQKNVFANSRLQQIQATRVENHTSFTFRNNVIYFGQGDSLTGPWDKIKVNSSNNIYWHSKGKPIKIKNLTLEEWEKKGKELGSSVVDPLFVDPSKNNFQVQEGSPALKLGIDFEAFKKAGLLKD